MLLGLSQPLLILLPSFAWAYPRASSTSALAISTSFPSYLQADVPNCAQPCLQTILRDEYPTTCSSAADIACYCTQYSSSGLSLGEAAYECAVASCTSTKNLASSYSICDGIAAAVAPTHTILTFTAQITSTASRATRTGSLSTPTVAHNSTVRSTSTPAANSASHASTLSTKQTPSSTSAHASSTNVPLTTATAANSNSTASYEKGGLSNSQVAGITVGGVAGAALLVGAVFFLAWLRKRHRRKNDDVLEKRDRDIWSVTPPADQGPDHLEPSDLAALGSLPRDPNANRGPAKDAKDPRSGGQVGVALPQTTVDRGWTIRLRTPSPPADQIGLAISQDPVAVDAALGSAASERTVSQLLPEKPEPAHHATGSGSDMDRMVQPSAAVVAVRPQLCRESSQTVFEEDSGRQWRRESVPSRNPPQLAPPMAVHHRPQFAEDYVQSPEALQATGMPTMAPPAPNHHRSTWPSPPPIPSPLRIQTSPTATAMITDRPVQDPSTVHAAVNPYVRVTQASSSSGGATIISSSGSVSQHPTQYTTSPSSMTKTPPEHYTPHVPQSTIRPVTQWPAGASPPPPQAPTTARIPTPPQFLQHSPSRYQQPPRKPVPQRRRASTASLTSIESASPNDLSPPEEPASAAKQLTPPESHPTASSTPPPPTAASQSSHNSSPISDLRYPKVPRSSNQAVPRGVDHSPNASSSAESTPVAVPPFSRSQAPSPSPAPETQTYTGAAGPTSYAANTSKALAARRLGPGAAEHLAKGMLFNQAPQSQSQSQQLHPAPAQQQQHPPSQHYPYPFPFHYQGKAPPTTTNGASGTLHAPAPPYVTVFHNGSSGALSAGPPSSSQQTGRTDRSSHASGGGDAVVPWKDYPHPSPHHSSGGGAGKGPRAPPPAGRNDSSDSCSSGNSGSNGSGGGKITVAGTVVLREGAPSQGYYGGGRGGQSRGGQQQQQQQAWDRYRAPAPQTQTGPGLYEGYGYGGDDDGIWSSTDDAASATQQRLTPTRDGGDLVLRVGPVG
ncbi:hypothetical protein IWX49DRAFT_186635 [Phyllosticta citricarpa]|uniref:CFEM domain-containing protein n=1 Tax=Phyllosticta paracitricarpa TaxID=2016321 RepID=A0ABR1NCF7_9PEZI